MLVEYVPVLVAHLSVQPALAAWPYLLDVARWAWRVKLSLHLTIDLMGELRERATHRHPADVEALREHALGRQVLAIAVLAAIDALADALA